MKDFYTSKTGCRYAPQRQSNNGRAFSSDSEWCNSGVVRVGKVQGPRVQGPKLTDLQILDCELHINACGGRALPGPAKGAIALPSRPAVIRGKGWREGKEKDWG